MDIDWNDYPLWQDETDYRTTLIVNQQHPAADDGNPGTAEAPLRTIQAAAERAEPATRIVIHDGCYREEVRPVRGGSGIDGMISFEAAEGESPIISGSEILPRAWERPRYWDAPYNDKRGTPSMSQRVWILPVPESLLPHGYDPLALPNVTPEEARIMHWMEPVADHAPFHLKRAMLFQDGTRLTQLHHYGDVPRMPGSFWIDPELRTLHLHPLKGTHPNEAEFELAVRSHLFRPCEVGLGFIRVAGLTFQHCANGLVRASTGAVTALGGHHWLIDHNTVRDINSSGIECSDFAFERKDPSPLNVNRDREVLGFNLIRDNVLTGCGTAGIRSLGVTEGRVLRNRISDCGWQAAEYYFECAGIKLLINRHTLVEGNEITGMRDACGIWLDWANQHSRVTGNTIRDIEAIQGGIFIEASRVPNLIDHNVIEYIDGPGIFGGECEDQRFLHNRVGPCTGPTVEFKKHTDRHLFNTPLLSRNNEVAHNVFVNMKSIQIGDDPHHFHDNKVAAASRR